MSFSLAALWILVGICPPWPPWPWPWPWPPPPWPTPNPWVFKIAGVVGALIGGWAYTQAFPIEGAVTAIDAAATAIGAFVGAVLATNIYGLTQRPRAQE